MPLTTIETHRLILRPHTLADFEPSHAMNTDPRVIAFLGTGEPATEEDSWNKLMRNAGFWQILGYGLFSILEKETGTYLGLTGLASFHRGLGPDFDPYPEAAWSISGDAHGKGYAREAALAAHEWFQANHGPTRTVAIVDAQNTPSLKVAEKLGYTAYGEAIYKGKRVLKFARDA